MISLGDKIEAILVRADKFELREENLALFLDGISEYFSEQRGLNQIYQNERGLWTNSDTLLELKNVDFLEQFTKLREYKRFREIDLSKGIIRVHYANTKKKESTYDIFLQLAPVFAFIDGKSGIYISQGGDNLGSPYLRRHKMFFSAKKL